MIINLPNGNKRKPTNVSAIGVNNKQMSLGIEISEVDYVGGEACRYVTYYNKDDDFDYGYEVQLYSPSIETPGEAIHKGQLPWEPIEYHSLSYGNDKLEADISCYEEENVS